MIGMRGSDNILPANDHLQELKYYVAVSSLTCFLTRKQSLPLENFYLITGVKSLAL